MAFVNPYTFIPLKNDEPAYGEDTATEDVVGERAYSGVLRCTLTAKTPLSIPDVSQRTDALDLPFFRKNGTPAIPGSSIRGCVRSVYEALTDSCLRTNNKRLHSASSKKRPALLKWRTQKLKYTQIELVDAERLRVVRDDLVRREDGAYRFEIAQTVRFQGKEDGRYATRTVEAIEAVAPRSQASFSHSETGYFLYVHALYAMADAEKPINHPSVFKESGGRRLLDEEDKDCFVENVSMYVENSKEAIPNKLEANASEQDKREYKRALWNYEAACAYQKKLDEFLQMKEKEPKRGDIVCLPVWYSSEKVELPDPESPGNKKTVIRYQLAPSQMSRSVYPQTPMLMVNKRAQCSTLSKTICPACTLFGLVSQNGGGAKAGRVRFCDATAAADTVRLISGQRLPTLLEPRQSAFEFYLRNDEENSEQEYTPYTSGTKLAGRKAYWHHQGNKDWVFRGSAQEVTKFNLIAELVDAGAVFRFDVYVDGVTRRELNQLVYALTYGEYWSENMGDHYHKIGHGKPIGLGSAKIAVTSVRLRTYDANTGEYTFDMQEDWKYESAAMVENGLSNVAAAKAVARFGAIGAGQKITYPLTRVGGEIYEWFAGNRDRRMDGEAGLAPVEYHQVLPRLGDDASQTLEAQIQRG